MSALADFRAAIQSGDHAGMVDALAADPVLHSPVTFKPFEGREAVSRLFEVLLEVFEDFRYVHEFEADGKAALIFEARVGDRELQGLDLFRFDADGKIAELTVMVRPASGLMALGEAVGARLQAA
ncbi:MAG TPA: nuclear transport factor 2 family protein [Solirubrobacteraceae bacterium]|nr:nuclear transport factor 2 family protein [Solirubrobacteraceae bacterium]